jgi:hypothetical protein
MHRTPSPLQHLLRTVFDLDLPISGGVGRADSPVVIHHQEPNDYVATEYAIVRSLCVGRQLDWRLVSTSLTVQDERRVDVLRIEVWPATDPSSVREEAFYFDITECYGR